MTHFVIIPQRYPCFDGSCPLSWAIYFNDEFCCYSWSYEGALRALKLIQETNQTQKEGD